LPLPGFTQRCNCLKNQNSISCYSQGVVRRYSTPHHPIEARKLSMSNRQKILYSLLLGHIIQAEPQYNVRPTHRDILPTIHAMPGMTPPGYPGSWAGVPQLLHQRNHTLMG